MVGIKKGVIWHIEHMVKLREILIDLHFEPTSEKVKGFSGGKWENEGTTQRGPH